MDPVAFLLSEWETLAEAPVIVLVGAVIFIVFGIAVGRWYYSERIAVLNERLNQYQDSTDSETPKEARLKIENLELRLQSIHPRALKPEQLRILVKELSAAPGEVKFKVDMAAFDLGALAGQLFRAFSEGGWKVHASQFLGAYDVPVSGLQVSLTEQCRSTPQAQTMLKALRTASIAFDEESVEPVVSTSTGKVENAIPTITFAPKGDMRGKLYI